MRKCFSLCFSRQKFVTFLFGVGSYLWLFCSGDENIFFVHMWRLSTFGRRPHRNGICNLRLDLAGLYIATARGAARFNLIFEPGGLGRGAPDRVAFF